MMIMPKRSTSKKKPIQNLVVISDTHCGCKLAVMPRSGAALDDAGTYMPSEFQQVLIGYWEEFWNEFVPDATHGEPFAVVHNGDAIDGVHHNSVTQISNNLRDQAAIAKGLLKPIVNMCEGRYYHIRGTEAHVGKSAQDEERLAEDLGAVKNSQGQHARYDLWIQVGQGLVHLLHHIGTTGSQAYESTAVHKELVESFTEAGRWGQRPPDIVVRSHRHRMIETNIPTEHGKARAVVTPAWQGKTPFVWKIPGGRLCQPQFGGLVIKWSESENTLWIKERVWSIKRSPTEIVTI
jgi:hypothetical protein